MKSKLQPVIFDEVVVGLYAIFIAFYSKEIRFSDRKEL